MTRWLSLVTAVTFVVVMSGGTLVWFAERDSSSANLKVWGDCLWWAVTTLSTVGYGEHFPVTLFGRLVAVGIMASGVAIIGAVAAVVAFAFASRLTSRLEAAVHHMETQVEHVEAEMENVSERVGGRHPLLQARTGLRELVIGVADSETASSLTWLLARLGWHPEAGDNGVSWRDGGVLLRVAIRPWDIPFGVQGRLTFGAGSPQRLARIAREAARHGFHRVGTRAGGEEHDGPLASPGIPSARMTAAASAPVPGGRNMARPALDAAPPSGDGASRSPDHGDADGEPVTLRAVSGFEVVLVTS